MRRTKQIRHAGELPEPPKERSGPIVPVLAFAGITVAVMQTLLVPVIKDLPVLLSTDPANATWVMTATLLAGAVSTPIMGRLGDLYGKRRMLLASLAVMVVGSLICASTDDLVVMITGRALQGFAMGAIPLGIGIMRDELPREKLGSAMALMSSSIGVGGGLALPAAALVAQHADWHALFLGSAGLGVLAMVLTYALVPEPPLRAPGTFDFIGAFGLSLGLVLLLLPVTKGGDWGWTSAPTLGLLAASVATLLLWGLFELRTPAPLVDLRTTARREVLLTNLASIMVGVAFYAVSLVLPQLLQLPTSTGYGLGQSMVVAGLCVAPLGRDDDVRRPALRPDLGPPGPQDHADARHGDHRDRLRGRARAAQRPLADRAHRGRPRRRDRPRLLLAARPDHRCRRPVGDRRGQRPQHPHALHRYVGVERRHRHGPGQHLRDDGLGAGAVHGGVPDLVPDRHGGGAGRPGAGGVPALAAALRAPGAPGEQLADSGPAPAVAPVGAAPAGSTGRTVRHDGALS
ncbi:Putative multidrug resistance protein MdtD [Streptomyces microflavus]